MSPGPLASRWSFPLALVTLAATCVVAAPVVCGSVAWARADAPNEVTVAVLDQGAPFSYRSDDGTWKGLAVELWQTVAADLHLDTRFEAMTRAELLDAVSTGRARFGVGPLSITRDRLERVDFSVPIYVTGVVIAVPNTRRSAWGILRESILSAEFLQLAVGLFVAVAIMGTILWIAERRINPDFAGRKIHGWGSGMWLSVVTMTTVGYGDKAPRTLPGRLVAAVWMFCGIVLISIFTGTVATLLTIERLGPRARGFEDLGHARIVSVTGSAAAQLLDVRQLQAQLVPDLEQALTTLREGRADALVFDRALLAAALKRLPELRITILPTTLRPEFYAVAMHPSEPLRQQINVAIARTLDSPRWGRLRYEYLGNLGEDR